MRKHSLFVITLFTIVLALAGISACSPPDKTPKIAESQRQALDKAKTVEATINQQAEAQKKQLEQQSE